MAKKRTRWSNAPGTRVLTRRDALTLGAVAATSLYLPVGLIRSASAQTVSFDYYVGPNGSDSNPGTLSQPWAITAINTKRSTYAGKTVGLLDGTYDLIASFGQPRGDFQSGVMQIAAGSSGSPTTIKAVNVGQAILDWNRAAQTTTSEAATFVPLGNYITIDGLVFDNNSYRCITNDNGGSGGSYLTIQNCLFRNQAFVSPTGTGGSKNTAQIYSKGFDHITISNCRFEGGNAAVDTNRHNNILFYSPTNYPTVENCTIISEALGCDLIHCKNGSVKFLTVRNCYLNRSAVTQTSQPGACLKWGDAGESSDDIVNIYNNVIVSGGSTAREIITCAPGTSGTWNIYKNTLVGPWSSSGSMVHVDQGAPVQMNIHENIFARVSGSSGMFGDVAVSSIATIGTMNYNLYPSSSPKFAYGSGPSSVTGLANWQTTSGGKDANSAASDPVFVGTGVEAAKYKLQAGSPGTTLGAGGAEIGGWAGVSQIGSSGGDLVRLVPDAPLITSVS